MTDIKAEDSYISYMMQKLPKPQKGEVRVVKKGDSLWNIAKEAVGSSKASKADISEYMLLIAKANGLDSFDKMNNIKAFDKIYMPKVQKNINNSSQKANVVKSTTTQSKNLSSQQSAKPAAQQANMTKTMTPKPAPSVSKTNATGEVKTINSKPVARTRAEQSALEMIAELCESKNVYVEKAALMLDNNLYHVSVPDTSRPAYEMSKRSVMSVTYDSSKNQISSVSFNDSKEDINPYAYDYKMDKNGKIYTNTGFDDKLKGTLDSKSLNQLNSVLREFIPKTR